MQIIHHLQIDLARRMPTPPIGAVQNEINTRAVSISLLENGAKWEVPEGVTAAVAFRKPDGKKGLYDQQPDGKPATTISGSTVTAILAPQTLTCAGTVLASIVFYDNNMDTLATFPFKIIVEQNPAAGEQLSNNYYYLQNMEQVNTAYNELLERMDALEQSCRVLYVGAEQPNDGTLYWLDTSEDEVDPDVPDVPEIPDEPDEPETVTYTVTNNLTNVTSNNSTESVEENASYTATLTAASGYELDTVTVTMGGTDVTATVYADGVVKISTVTGNVVITATGIAQTDNNLVESNIIIYHDSPASENDVAQNEAISSSEYVYYLKYPKSSYQKKISIRATYTSSYGYANVINEMTVGACNNGDSDIAIEAYDHFDDRGYVVFKVHIPTLLGKYQSMIDDGTLNTAIGTRCYFHFEYTNAGYILSDYFG